MNKSRYHDWGDYSPLGSEFCENSARRRPSRRNRVWQSLPCCVDYSCCCFVRNTERFWSYFKFSCYSFGFSFISLDAPHTQTQALAVHSIHGQVGILSLLSALSLTH